jgi:hypothetical protein
MINKTWVKEKISELSKLRYTDKHYNDSIHWRHIRQFESELLEKLSER